MPDYDFMDYGLGEKLEALDDNTRTEIADLLAHTFKSYKNSFVWMPGHAYYSDDAAPLEVQNALAFTWEKDDGDNWNGQAPIIVSISPDDFVKAFELDIATEDCTYWDEAPQPIPDKAKENWKRLLTAWRDAIGKAEALVDAIPDPD